MQFMLDRNFFATHPLIILASFVQFNTQFNLIIFNACREMQVFELQLLFNRCTCLNGRDDLWSVFFLESVYNQPTIPNHALSCPLSLLLLNFTIKNASYAMA